MATKTKSAPAATPAAPAANTGNNGGKYNRRRWVKPNVRAKNYAEERKARIHKRGRKEGEQLTEFEAGLRSGYLQCQSDHAGLFKYKKAINEGKSKQEAREISQRKGKN